MFWQSWQTDAAKQGSKGETPAEGTVEKELWSSRLLIIPLLLKFSMFVIALIKWMKTPYPPLTSVRHLLMLCHPIKFYIMENETNISWCFSHIRRITAWVSMELCPLVAQTEMTAVSKRQNTSKHTLFGLERKSDKCTLWYVVLKMQKYITQMLFITTDSSCNK